MLAFVDQFEMNYDQLYRRLGWVIFSSKAIGDFDKRQVMRFLYERRYKNDTLGSAVKLASLACFLLYLCKK